jgi:ribonucleoside-diphosphate reductase alpha chain
VGLQSSVDLVNGLNQSITSVTDIHHSVIKRDGSSVPFDRDKLRIIIKNVSARVEGNISVDLVLSELDRTVFDGITTIDIERALILACVSFIERDPAYGYVAACLVWQRLFKEVTGESVGNDPAVYKTMYAEAFVKGIQYGVKMDIFDERLLEFDLETLSKHIVIERDNNFSYLGAQTLYERYFVKHEGMRFEMPQSFWMRVAMGLSVGEKDRTRRALEFYDVLSTMRFVNSTPTLYHSGFKVAQLSSCYLGTVGDDLSEIFKSLGDSAQLSKWAGGVGYDWTNIRATGSAIKSIKATSQGVIPFLKLANDVVVAITRSGIRRGGTCSYLESWHLEIEDFLDLRRNTGDERRRTHDMNTANWIPDLFMKRVVSGEQWTLFSPNNVPDLHSLYGKAFEKRYEEYEQMTLNGQIAIFKTIPAKQLWRKMLSRLFETGHPWITFKDACNVRSPQDHVGVVNCSNLCTEITLNTSKEETAVCNLGSVNLKNHIGPNGLDYKLLEKTVTTAVRMLDNVIDINFYPTKEAKNSNLKHRPVGLGMMGFQDALFKQDLAFQSSQALDFADEAGEVISYYAIQASADLAAERGAYQSYKGSKWDRSIFPLDTVALLEAERGVSIERIGKERMDWGNLKKKVASHGMRNSTLMAVAPTATISNISGCFPCIEPIFKNIYVKANQNGEFVVVNEYLVKDLKKQGLWSKDTLDLIKYYDGNISLIPSIPENLKQKYKTAFEIDPKIALRMTAARGKWIDQSQSHNVFMQGVSGKLLNDIYLTAWRLGLKTTYYLRTLAATQVEKSTLDAKKFGYTQKRVYDAMPGEPAEKEAEKPTTFNGVKRCKIDDEECESCQ